MTRPLSDSRNETIATERIIVAKEDYCKQQQQQSSRNHNDDSDFFSFLSSVSFAANNSLQSPPLTPAAHQNCSCVAANRKRARPRRKWTNCGVDLVAELAPSCLRPLMRPKPLLVSKHSNATYNSCRNKPTLIRAASRSVLIAICCCATLLALIASASKCAEQPLRSDENFDSSSSSSSSSPADYLNQITQISRINRLASATLPRSHATAPMQSARTVYTLLQPNQKQQQPSRPKNSSGGHFLRLNKATQDDELNYEQTGRSKDQKSKLAQLHAQINELRRQLDLTLTATQRDSEPSAQVALGSPCTSSKDCSRAIANGHCNVADFTCACLPQHTQLNSTHCLPPALLGFECKLDAQCRKRVPDSFCSKESQVCECERDKFVSFRRDKCLPGAKLDEFCMTNSQCELADKHSFCQWKIVNVYGVCKCPANFKRVQIGDNNASTTATNTSTIRPSTKCAPRLGDICLDDSECLLATKNAHCAAETGSDASPSMPPLKWRSSSAQSARRCACLADFQVSSSKLDCEPRRIIATTTTTTTESPPARVSFVDSKHSYELLAMSDANKLFMTNATIDFKIVDDVAAAAAASDNADANGTRTPVTTATPSAHPMKPLTGSPPPKQKQRPVRGAIATSLGKACSSGRECKLRDINSDCIKGVCECMKPTPKCSSKRRGCHADTFQCRNGQCISWYFVCDSFKNCDDGSDEDDCRRAQCPSGSFQCLGDGKCVARGKICDGQADCDDASDEAQCSPRAATIHRGAANLNSSIALVSTGCHPLAHTCADGQCVPAYAFCNAVADCADGSDELEQVCERRLRNLPLLATTNPTTTNRKDQTSAALQPATTPRPAFATPSSPPPPPRDRPPEESPLVRVSGRDALDKLLAAATNLARRTPENRGKVLQQQQRRRAARLLIGSGDEQCPPGAFTCSNGKCRSTAILCSGVDGCGDGSDESHCEVCQCAKP